GSTGHRAVRRDRAVRDHAVQLPDYRGTRRTPGEKGFAADRVGQRYRCAGGFGRQRAERAVRQRGVGSGWQREGYLMTSSYDEDALRHWLADYLVTNVGCSLYDMDFTAPMSDLGLGARG